MITQYTRLIVNKSDGSIEHCTSQDFPFADGWEPVGFDSSTHAAIDFEIDTDYPDVNFGLGVNQEMIRARKIMENFEVVSGQPKLKSDADAAVSDKVLRVSPVKPITETLVKAEMAEDIKSALTNAGSSEKELLNSMKQIETTIPDKIEDLKMVQVIRIKKELVV